MVIPKLGIVAALEWSRGRPWTLILMAGSMMVSAGLNLYDCFARYPRQPGLFDAFEAGLWTLNQAAAKASQTGVAYLVLDEPGLQHPTTRLTRELAPGDLRVVNGGACIAHPAKTTAETLFATMPQWIPEIRASYPQAAETNILHEPEVCQYAALLRVPAGQTAAVGAARAVGLAEFGGLFDLLAIETPEEAFAPGTVVPITLHWRAVASPAVRYTSFVHLTRPDVPLLAGVDVEPCQGWYPTNEWHPGEIAEYRLDLPLPPDLLPGKYELAVGMYDWITGARLPLSRGEGREPDRAFVKTLIVK